GRSCRARAAKLLNAGAATASTAVTEPNRSQSPRCPCKAPPKFYHPMVRRIAGRMAPVYLSLWRSIGSKAMEKMGKLATPPNYPNGRAGPVSGQGETFQGHGRHFLTARLRLRYRTTAPPDARELAQQLNHLPASATNE